MWIPAILFAVVLLAIGVVFGRMIMRRDAARKLMEFEAERRARASGETGEAVEPGGRRKRMNRRDKLLATLEPDPEIPSVIDLMNEEARETGVNEIAGGDGLEVPLKLKVWHRDGAAHEDCPREALRYEIAAGLEPSQATVDDVTLRCSAAHPTAPPDGDDGTA